MPSEGSERRRVPPLSSAEREFVGEDASGDVLAAEQAKLSEQYRRHEDDRHSWQMDWLKREQDIREEYADKVWRLAIRFLIGVAIVVLFDSASCPWGIGSVCVGFDVATPVLVGILGTTTATILGLMYIVLRHHFPEASKASKE